MEASKKCLVAAFSVTMFLLFFFKGETLKLGSEEEDVVVFDEYDPRKHAVDDPEEVVRMFHMAIRNSTKRRKLHRRGHHQQQCKTVNPIDKCSQHCVNGRPYWRRNRKKLADCALGFGRNAIGGRDGKYYYVTTNQDDPVNPKPGSLRYGVIQKEPLWIVFKRDMVIRLKQELMINSFKTIDARGKCVVIAHGAALTLQYVHNVIITGLTIHNIISTGNAMVRDSPDHYGWRTMADGDGISLFGASHVWIDHNTISRCADGLVDAIMGSTGITVTNNHFSYHNEVMLLGHSDAYTPDKAMQVTIAFNHFGEGLIQRMPRCRHGYFHVVNNYYTHWEMYAIGGSAQPTINSQGNRFLAPANVFAKEVTKRVYATEDIWKFWEWRSVSELFLNGAYFTSSGTQNPKFYTRASSTTMYPSSMVGRLTRNAGAIYHGKRRCSIKRHSSKRRSCGKRRPSGKRRPCGKRHH